MASDQALRDLIMASNPVGYYPLDTLANLGRDISTIANHGSQSGSFRQQVLTFSDMDFVVTGGVTSSLVAIPDRAEYRGRTFTMECIISHNEDTNLVIAERGGDNKNWSLQSIGSAAGMATPSYQFILGDQAVSPANGRAGPATAGHLVFTSVNGVTKVYLNGEPLMIGSAATGNGIQGNQGNLPIHLFSRGGLYATSAVMAHVAFYNRELTTAELAARKNLLNKPFKFKLQPMTAVAANQEPRSQFQPQDVAWRGTPPMWAGPVNLQQQTQYPLCKGRDYFWIRDGVRNVEQGYIESTVTISGVGVRRRVLCFTQDGELVGETYSRASDGVYRFDLLWLNRRYMVVAQDDPAYGPADYNAVAADYQVPKPYPPGGGVAPAPFPMLAPLKRK
ncbi:MULTISPECIES: LamG domain-containing protein [Aeromonas]|uniref:LamG domain-containing protein n=2 Tax=Aeromonas TaxID=642 RepID=UPI000AB79F48|nr:MULTISPECIES: LamG domain-containing protein [Aeromonas]UBQ51079.1 LamG domain-containing protein [Aeromonas hydrophila]